MNATARALRVALPLCGALAWASSLAGQIVTAWVFTIPACFMLAWAIRSLFGLVGI